MKQLLSQILMKSFHVNSSEYILFVVLHSEIIDVLKY